MKLSVIIPCHPRNKQSLPRLLQSLQRAASGLDLEQLVIEDADARGPAWSRNQGLDRATGEYVFFADADDAVRENFFSLPLSRFRSTGADMVFAQTDHWPFSKTWDLTGNAAVRAELLPAFFGYSMDDVRRWNAGGRLDARREGGYIFRCAFRRDFLERFHLRFDEQLRFSEDAAFLSACALYAERIAMVAEVTYDYKASADGAGAIYRRGEEYWQYKLAALANRRSIANRDGAGAVVLAQFAASAVFTSMELLRFRRWRELRQYTSDPWVVDCLREFPCAWCHSLTALARFLVLTYAKLSHWGSGGGQRNRAHQFFGTICKHM